MLLYSLKSVDFVYHHIVNKRSYHRSIVVLKLYYNNGNSNPSRHLYIWFTCKFYWVRLIYRFWATFSTTKRSIRGTRGLIEVMSLPRRLITSIAIMKNHFKLR
uniref:photosystem II protein N n=1 Tax=Anaphalis busua TaxID=1209451 RepID=UPI0030FF1FB5